MTIVHEDGARPVPRWSTVLAASGVVFFVGLYVYNTIRFDQDVLRGDQWVWVDRVLLPLERGELSLFDAVTYEYANLSHSHIPTLAAFIFNREVLGLDLTVDAVVGVAALVATLGVILRHCRRELPPARVSCAVAVSASFLFLSSSAEQFAWSLLQFQMLYVFVAVFYLHVFARRVEGRSTVLPFVLVPATLLLGDAIGVAAVVASLLYLAGMVVRRTVPFRAAVPFAVSFVGTLGVGLLLRGEADHGGQPLTAFLEQAVSRPGDLITGAFYAVSTSLVGLRLGDEGGLAPLSWDLAWLWFAAAVAVVGVAGAALVRVGLQRRDRFPLLLMMATGVWLAGVLRSRLWLQGPAALQSSRYASYLTLFGLGLTLLVIGRWSDLGRGRFLAGAVIVAAVAANGVGSVRLSMDEAGVERQDLSLVTIRSYVAGEAELPVTEGRQCKVQAPCLRAAMFLDHHDLGPFAGGPPGAPRWLWIFQEATFTGLERAEAFDRGLVCKLWSEGPTDEALVDGFLPALGIPALLRSEAVDLSPERLPRALRSFGQILDSECAVQRPAPP